MGRAGLIAAALAVASPPAAVAADESATLVLRWESIPGASEYLLEIAENRSFESVITSERTPHAAFRFVPPSADASYFFRVAAVDQHGRVGEFSRAMAIQQILPAPTLVGPTDSAVIDRSGPPPAVTLEWQAVADARSYRVEISTDASATTEESSTTALTWHPPELGTYTWSVAAVDKSGLVGHPSLPRSLRVRTAPAPPRSRQLPAPELSSPAPDSTLVLVAPDKPPVELAWKPVPGAKGYRIEVAGTPGLESPESRDVTDTRAALWTTWPGDTYWRVRAHHGEWSEPRKLSLVPRARRVQMIVNANGTSEHTVVVTIADEAGDGVPGVPLTGSTTAGHLTPFDDRGDGSYVATWSGDAVATVSVAGPFELSASTDVAAVVDDVRWFAGGRAGLLTNFSAEASPRVLVHGGYRLPWLSRRLFVTAVVGYAHSSQSFDDQLSVAAHLHRLPMTLAAGYGHPLEHLQLFGTVGLALDPFVGTVAVNEEAFASESGFLVGLDVAAGAAFAFGPGQVFGELGLRVTSGWEGLFELGGAALVVNAGYTVDLF